MSLLYLVLKISRPAFWLYLAGPFLVGYIAGVQSIESIVTWQFLYSSLYFLIPANIFLYGVNDFFDADTDAQNPKKLEKESRLSHTNKQLYTVFIFFSLVLSIPMFLILSHTALYFFCTFLLLSYFYSAPPFRFKSHPFVDFSSNALYIIPGIIGYSMTQSNLPSLYMLSIAFSWTSAMHLFSAIPDIESDAKAQLKTTAVVLGKKTSLIVCALLWTYTLVSSQLLPFFIYPALCIWLLCNRKSSVISIYWFFPYINTVVGFVLFLLVANKFL